MTDFNVKAETWDDDPIKVKRAILIAEHISKTIKGLSHVNAMEYGAGTGLLSFELMPFLDNVLLVDTSEGMLSIAQNKINSNNYSKVETLKADFLIDPLPTRKFNLIFSLMTLHHITELDKILHIFYSLMENDSYLFVADLVKEDGSFHGKGFSGHNGFDLDELKELLLQTGFKNIDSQIVMEIEKYRDNELKKYPLFLMSGQK
ncbi:MAG: class I SAM-dependent methyltransferase [Melioribacteraceae bacterium]|nr:class I SAM-dependent methyltransferase [Melioribacteraceae bacterium]